VKHHAISQARPVRDVECGWRRVVGLALLSAVGGQTLLACSMRVAILVSGLATITN
jgi:hypothetical protein